MGQEWKQQLANKQIKTRDNVLEHNYGNQQPQRNKKKTKRLNKYRVDATTRDGNERVTQHGDMCARIRQITTLRKKITAHNTAIGESQIKWNEFNLGGQRTTHRNMVTTLVNHGTIANANNKRTKQATFMGGSTRKANTSM